MLERMGRQVLVACFVLLVWFGPRAVLQAEEVIHLFVALADNDSQGLVPVPAKIGNGDDPANNLYWGCDEGVKSWFSRSAKWKRVQGAKPSRPEVLERLVFKHKEKDAWLVADAWRGSEMKACMKTLAAAIAGQGGEVVSVGEKTLKVGGDATMCGIVALWAEYQDSPDSTYIEVAAIELALAAVAIAGGFLALRHR